MRGRPREPASIRSIAAALGISPTHVYRILRGAASPEAMTRYGRLARLMREGKLDPASADAAQPMPGATTLGIALTPAQAARILQVSERTMRSPLRRGAIPHARIGRQYRISLQAVLWFLASRGVYPLHMPRSSSPSPTQPLPTPPPAAQRGDGT